MKNTTASIFESSLLRQQQIVAWLLAIFLSGASLTVAAYVGWYRGGSTLERSVMVSMLMAITLSTHILLPWMGRLPMMKRLVFSLIWGSCLLVTLSSHVEYFLVSQDHAGDRRVAVMMPAKGEMAAAPKRSLLDAEAEREKVTGDLAKEKARSCMGNCSWRQVKVVNLQARLKTLEVEAEEAKRWQRERDVAFLKAEQQGRKLQGNRGTTILADWLGIPVDLANYVFAVLMSLGVEGAACVAWFMALSSSRQSPVLPLSDQTADDVLGVEEALRLVEEVSDGKTEADEIAPDSTHTLADQDIEPGQSATVEEKEAWLKKETVAGRFKPVVRSVRRHLGCSQYHARDFAAQLKELIPKKKALELKPGFH